AKRSNRRPDVVRILLRDTSARRSDAGFTRVPVSDRARRAACSRRNLFKWRRPMMDDETRDSNGMLLFALGAATGAALACLFAPASGRDTREYLFNGAQQAR